MTNTQDLARNDRLQQAANIVTAYLGANKVTLGDLPSLIKTVYDALGQATQPEETPTDRPAVDPKRSVFKDHIVCLCCGRKMTSLKRHVQSAHGLSVEAYQDRWGLPRAYPMVAPAYAARRAELAREMGLGRVMHHKADAPPPEPPVPAPRKRRRKAVS